MILPFTAFSWSAFGGKFGMAAVRVLCDVPGAGPSAASQTAARMKGRRLVIFQNAEVAGRLFSHPDDRLPGNNVSLWWTGGIKATQVSFGGVVDQFHAAKGDLDFAVFDIESNASYWNLTADNLAAIYADPRYKDLAATGRFPADCRNMSAADIYLFNYGCGYLAQRAIHTALAIPLFKHYNGVNYCNYGDAAVSKEDAPFLPDLNGHPQYQPTPKAPYCAPVVYGAVNLLGWQDPRFKVPFYNVAWSINFIRAAYRGKPDAKVSPWLAPKTLSNVLDDDSWQELIFHACCLCGLVLLFFNADASALSNWRFDYALSQFVGQCRGKEWRGTLITDLTRYDTDNFIVTACKLADGSVVGRVTFKTGTDTATVTVAGGTYTVNRVAGSLGAWFHS